MKPYFFVSIILLLVFTSCGPQSTPVAEPASTSIVEATVLPTTVVEPESPFSYEASVPFDVKINSQEERDDVLITDLSYAAHDSTFSLPTGGRTVAYLVSPKGEGPFAGVIYFHWLGNPNSNRNEFLDEAVSLAQHGVVSLLLQGTVPWMSAFTLNQTDRSKVIGQVVEVRRGIDFLLTQPGVDPDRLAVVGHDYGAMYAGSAAGVEDRVKTYIIIAGAPSYADFAAVFGAKRDEYLPMVQDIDPIQQVVNGNPSSFFFQFAKSDQFISLEDAQRFYDAASEPKKLGLYDDNHQMASEQVLDDRLAWLVEQLGLE